MLVEWGLWLACSGLPSAEVDGTIGLPYPQKEELQMPLARKHSCKILSERVQIQDQTGFSPDLQGRSPAIPIKRKVVSGAGQGLSFGSQLWIPVHTGN